MENADRASYLYPEAIISAAALSDRLDDPNLRLFDCTVYLRYDEAPPGAPYRVESGRADYQAGHIPGAAFIDLQADLSDNSSPSHLRFTMLPLDQLAQRFARLGITDGTQVVLYSRASMQWATRVWWMLRAVGFDSAAVLDGGLDKWMLDDRALEQGIRVYPAGELSASPRPGLFVGKQQVLEAMGDSRTCVLNALAADLHSGENARYGRPGRIPGSVNVPATALVDAESKEFLSPAAVQEKLAAVGATRAGHTLVYCGGGIAATLDAFLLRQLGHDSLSIYDASMSEWAKDESLPIETG